MAVDTGMVWLFHLSIRHVAPVAVVAMMLPPARVAAAEAAAAPALPRADASARVNARIMRPFVLKSSPEIADQRPQARMARRVPCRAQDATEGKACTMIVIDVE